MERTLNKEYFYPLCTTLAQVMIGSLVIALLAQISIALPFSLVPFTGQTLGVMGVGAFLGSKKGGAASLLYLVEGAIGWPVFAGGVGGVTYFLGATGGYLLTYPLVSYYVGKTYENQALKAWEKLGLLTYISVLQLSTGSLWLASFLGIKQAYLSGFSPFILLELCKVGMVWTLIKRGRK
ncbi:MAG: biotin transporter BioY [Chlamydiales bacterium]|nr:biotin transporter BioY [Chlamydiales bacterium]